MVVKAPLLELEPPEPELPEPEPEPPEPEPALPVDVPPAAVPVPVTVEPDPGLPVAGLPGVEPDLVVVVPEEIMDEGPEDTSDTGAEAGALGAPIELGPVPPMGAPLAAQSSEYSNWNYQPSRTLSSKNIRKYLRLTRASLVKGKFVGSAPLEHSPQANKGPVTLAEHKQVTSRGQFGSAFIMKTLSTSNDSGDNFND